ncbi:unnamed protein product [Adineta steineri]|uniref:Uncharacterized protein n=1 Tax=Adineta steineri TaxID=433720 RepID=A0A818V9C6_9BILA|nr:unnamed protein product [Adineta steineri]
MRHRINVCILLFLFITVILLLTPTCPVIEESVPISQPSNIVILINNRVPKCASYFTRTIVKRLSVATHAFASENSENHYECRLDTKKQEELRNELLEKAQNAHQHQFIYTRHFHFVNFRPEPGVNFHYINHIRDPIDQIVSGYYYNRYICMITSPTKTCTYYPPSIYNLTLDECISNGDPARCLTKTYGSPEYLVYFCGQSPLCSNINLEQTSQAALTMAKTNIERYYMHIGLVEYLKNSYEILEHLQPSMFKGLVHMYQQMKNTNRTTSTPKWYRHQPSTKTRDILKQLLAPEYELYEFVRERFMRQYSDIFQRPPTHSK